MTGMASIHGGAHHGMATLTHAEQEAARNALAKLKTSGGLGVHLDNSIRSATVYSGSAVKGTGANTSLLQGHGSDTFIGGARSGLAPLGSGSDTVVSGSTASGIIDHKTANTMSGHTFALSADTVNVAGATAEALKAGHAPESTSSHTITLADKTKVTITGVPAHDITKLSH
jgi:hypothetical protein